MRVEWRIMDSFAPNETSGECATARVFVAQDGNADASNRSCGNISTALTPRGVRPKGEETNRSCGGKENMENVRGTVTSRCQKKPEVLFILSHRC